ncbi:Long polar fimbria protein A [Enterobacter asburiae]|uniref:Long polar fimbria protein A n=1 Tax=Enterobacter asburiae TaxID=61645 RepID=A0A376F5R7_ENTAS|nr:Long polar fimbria protein A [Enterobacter asburiae]
MKKITLGLFITAALGCSASSFAASTGEGQINFTGEIIDSACQVVNGISSPLNVALGKVSKTTFTGAGSTSTLTKFDIQLKDCRKRSRLQPSISVVRQMRIITPRWP